MMKRISYAVMSTLTALVLLFGYRTSTSSRSPNSGTVIIGASAPSSSTTTSASSTPSTDAGSPTTSTGSTASAASTASTASTASSSKSSSPSATSAVAKTVTGTAADTRWGPVQVQLIVKNGKITNVSVVEYPNNNGRDQEINATALPVLVDETLKTQSARIDMVSGATYTSQGYLTSLQSAIDKAGL